MASFFGFHLVCAVCGVESEWNARGWRALPRREDDDAVSVQLFCPDCAAQEFAEEG
jgi:hypothetical protein